jgi:hypothetical protein
MCAKGVRQFLQRRGMSWTEFLKKGIDSDVLLATGDAMAIQVVENANGRTA